jgi:YHYH protein/Secretion system C-terminal sorting domain
MNRLITLIAFLSIAICGTAQNNPIITSWIINNDGTTGSHYVSGNSTAIQDNVEINCQTISYSDNWVYVNTNGIPAYPTGPFLDGNPSLATDQNAIFKFPLTPLENTGNPTATTGGNIGVFINGVALFDYRDGVSWNNNSQAEGGGPIQGPPGQGIWNRDAVVAEREGFDCAKGHPAMGNYHHHQNPSAFDLDITPVSDICNLYDADGLYAINASEHSPLIGFAYDGFPIYGAYGFLNTDGTGGIVRIKSGYQLRNITERTHYADGTDVTDGPEISAEYPLGRYREDYEFVAHTEPDYLDEHNGRFCVTPEYPEGIYAYFCTVDENWNSAYPYAVGPTFYGVKVAAKVNSITESVTEYNGTIDNVAVNIDNTSIGVYPNPSSDFIAVQIKGLVTRNITINLFDMSGKLVQTSTINSGSTITYFDTQSLYEGQYVLEFNDGQNRQTKTISVLK